MRAAKILIVKSRPSLFGFLLGLLVSGLLLSCRTGQNSGNLVSIFDGNTFQGWEGDTTKTFRVRNGAIVGGSLTQPIPQNEFLCTTRYYTNFEVRLKCKLVGGADANGGVQIRSRRIPNDSELIGYQADMAEYKGECWWGCLYDESRRKDFLARPDAKAVAAVLKRGGWNDYVIRCEGRRIRMWLNGLQTVDFTEPDVKLENYGVIGLQIHRGEPSEASYKDIFLQELP